ncbi:flagellar basal-body rod protein FlgF [Thioclava atlantica]|uniref:Flagellar basal-body rod protein FlgF n=1 Tax=Thioclava atlantica TaxID=1317124 RepID=A0A085TYA2_9RHOB|nr:flagellar basal-body rod protein FlgF [Thioclava atlantica]KFE35699.1 flagellar basal body rod protein FlgF [Thioclava atlantica]
MDSSNYVSLSLASTLWRSLDISANNMANANTAGFKAERSLTESFNAKGGGDAANDVSYVLDRGSYLDNRQGSLTRTSNPLDVALNGDGWLAYTTPAGQTAFGRDGRLAVDPQGNLVTLSGNRVLDRAGAPIAIPPGEEITISRDGTISSAESGTIGTLGVFTVPDIQSFSRLGGGLFAAPGNAAPALTPAETTQVAQGFIEESNVQPVVEMTRMMDIQRSYERAVKLMDEQDNLRQETLRRLGRS